MGILPGVSVMTCDTTIRQWVKNHTKDEIAMAWEDMSVMKDARIAFLEAALEEARMFCKLSAEKDQWHGDLMSDGYVSRDCRFGADSRELPALYAYLTEG